MPLDEFLPRFDFHEEHSTRVAASPKRVAAAARALTVREVPLLVVLMVLRRAPLLVRGRRFSLREPVVDEFLAAGFVLLAERSTELVLGAVGRFWQLDSGMRKVAASEFVGFDEPGYAKAVMDFRAEPTPAGSVFSTETRIQTPDERSRQAFGRYWKVIRPGSGIIRHDLMRAVRRRAEGG